MSRLIALSALLACILAIIGASWLPDPATRQQGAILAALAAVLAVNSFVWIERAWPRPEVSDQRPEVRGQRSEVVRSYVGVALLVGGLALVGWALKDIWSMPFVLGQAWRWLGGLALIVLGAYLIGTPGIKGQRSEVGDQRSEVRGERSEVRDDLTQPAVEAALIGPRPSGYKLQAIGRDAPLPEDLGAGPGQGASPVQGASLAPLPATSDHRPLYGHESRIHAPTDEWRPARWVVALLVILVMGAGVWFRVYQIDRLPPGIFIDETNTVLDALRVFEGRQDSPFGTGWFETPNGFVYLQMLFLRLFGVTFTAIKVQSLLPGILTVIALFFLARELFDTRVALFATAFLAFNRWHFNMSRWGWNEVYPPLMQVLAVLFLLRGARRRHWGDWALAGLFLGLGMYTYLAIRMAVVAIFLYLAYRAVVEWIGRRQAAAGGGEIGPVGAGGIRWGPGMAYLSGAFMFVLVFAITLAPLGFTYLKNPFTFLNRSQQVSIMNDVRAAGGDLAPLRESIVRHLQMFHVAGDGNPRHNLPRAPMLDPITGAFFILGLAWAVWRWRDHRRGLLLIWIPVTLLGGVLSLLNEAPQGYRTLAVTPALAILAADAYDLSLRALLHPARRYRLWRWFVGVLAVTGLSVAAWLNYATYWQQQATDPAVYTAFSPLENTVASEVLAKRDDHRLYLSSRLYYFSPLRFLAYEPTEPIGIRLGPWTYSPFQRLGGGLDQPGYNLADPVVDLPLPDLGGDNALFMIDLHFQHVLDLFTYYYPGTRAEVVYDRLQRPLYLSVTVPGHEIQALQARNRADEHAAILGLYIPASGVYSLRSVGGAGIELDGRMLAAVDGADGSEFLGKGLHATRLFDVPADLPADAPVLWWEGAAGSGPVPDVHLFRQPPSGQGLLGVYYAGSDWTPPPLMQRVDPLLLFAWPDPEPVFGPFSVTWTGELLAPVEGSYLFKLDADDGVRLWLNDQVVGESLIPDTVNQVNAAATLSAGAHRIRIDYFQRGGGKALEFYWQPPGQPQQPVGSQFLRP